MKMRELDFSIILIISISSICLSHQSSGNWTYSGEHGPENWSGVCKNGNRQSPINIVTDDTVKADLGSLIFTRYDFAYTGTLTNNGHSLQITLSGVPVVLTGGGLTSTYVLEQMHFHWGAEHTIDGVRDALELHLVHYDKQYGNVSIASQSHNGISVVAVLFKLSDDDNEKLYPILKAAEAVSEWVGMSSVEIQRKVIPMQLLPNDRTTFYRYEGSLTTPGCQEAVTWFIMSEKLSISEAQLKVFKSIRTNHGVLKQNYRPTQNIGDRKVYHHLLGYTSSSPTIFVNYLFISMIAFYIILN
ncbi:putative carbonic anhydrase 3 [Chelonus insularis]|uniref:putative carbonic anhydrase 3 n=1 Tax=Chelonus insularis TaxID=460826 RepID=UPI00158CBF14|nr:putative carbonic anhydrase 3 [Chelonus insularis]